MEIKTLKIEATAMHSLDCWQTAEKMKIGATVKLEKALDVHEPL